MKGVSLDRNKDITRSSFEHVLYHNLTSSIVKGDVVNGFREMKGACAKFEVADDMITVQGSNANFRLLKDIQLREGNRKQKGGAMEDNYRFYMAQTVISKDAITPKHNKMVVLKNQSCPPFIEGLTYQDYVVQKSDSDGDSLEEEESV
jgi:hypothetical protein